MALYTTRLLVLGVVRIFGPAHGYLLLQELNSWKVDQWANVKPGSVYSSLHTLTKEGLVEVSPQDGKDTASKAAYQITAAGLTEFDQLLQRAVLDVDLSTIATIMAAISFLPFLPRSQAVHLLEERAERLAEKRKKLERERSHLEQHPDLAPPHVAEHFHCGAEALASHERWVAAAVQRIQDGAYSFAGESSRWAPPENDPIWGRRRSNGPWTDLGIEATD